MTGHCAYAIDAETVRQLGADDSEVKLAAIQKLLGAADPQAAVLLKALQGETLVRFKEQVLIVDGDSARDAVSGVQVSAPAEHREAIVLNNRLRAALDGAIAALNLVSSDTAERLAAARAVVDDPSEAMLPLIRTALSTESDSEVKRFLNQARALIEIKSSDPAVRREAVKLIGSSDNPEAYARRRLLRCARLSAVF
jgi:urea transport system permease protein